MLYREFGRTGWSVSATGLGTWNIGNQWGEMDNATAEGIVHAAIDGGVNLVDAAESYGIPNGMSELRLGKALKGKRNGVYLVSKIGNWGKRTGQGVPLTTPDMIRLCGHAILGRLRSEWVDVVLCHEGGIEDPSIYIEGFNQLCEEGSIRRYGISTNNLEVLERFNDMSDGKCAVAEIDYSLINREPEKELIPYCMKSGIAILVRGPVAKGLLAGKYGLDTEFADSVRKKWNKGEPGREGFEKQLAAATKVAEVVGDRSLVMTALQYVISHPAAPVAIPGATTSTQAEANAVAGAEALPDDLYQKLKSM